VRAGDGPAGPQRGTPRRGPAGPPQARGPGRGPRSPSPKAGSGPLRLWTVKTTKCITNLFSPPGSPSNLVFPEKLINISITEKHALQTVCVLVQFETSRWLSSDVDESMRTTSIDLDSYLHHMSKATTYGDGIMLEMAVVKYKRPICIVSKDFKNGRIFLSNPEVDLTQSTCRPMFLAYTGCNHYDSILPCPTIYSSAPQVAVPTSPDGPSDELSPVSEPVTSTAMSSESAMSTHSVAEPKTTGTDSSAGVMYPSIWTFDIWKSWTSKQPWLICQNGKIGCKVCLEAGTALTMKTGVHLSPEWTSVSVEAKTGRKLKEKIYRHKDSTAHMEAVKILQLRQQECFKNVVVDADSRYFEETSRVFRTAYAIAKMDMAFTAHRDLLTLQEANGLDIGKVHRSDHSCAKIITHISNQMKTKFCERLKSLEPHVAVMLDESTLFKTSVIAVYLRARLADTADITEEVPEWSTYGVTNVFFGLLEASEGCNATGIMAAVESEFDRFHLNDDLLLKNKSLIAICTDGASVMTGASSGVATQFVNRYGHHVEPFHCLAHRLELAVHDACT